MHSLKLFEAKLQHPDPPMAALFRLSELTSHRRNGWFGSEEAEANTVAFGKFKGKKAKAKAEGSWTPSIFYINHYYGTIGVYLSVLTLRVCISSGHHTTPLSES